jgi:hypothetical protein
MACLRSRYYMHNFHHDFHCLDYLTNQVFISRHATLMNIHILFQTFLTLDLYPIPRLLHSLSQFLLQLAQPNELEAAHSSKQPNSFSLLCSSCLSDPCISFVPSSVLQDSITASPLAHEQPFESS